MCGIFFRTSDRWNFGLCATIPREPRQARKGATVTGQFRVPRSTRSSSLVNGSTLRNRILLTKRLRPQLKLATADRRGAESAEKNSLIADGESQVASHESRVTNHILL